MLLAGLWFVSPGGWLSAQLSSQLSSQRGEPMVGRPRRSVVRAAVLPAVLPARWAYGLLAQKVGGPSSCAPSCAPSCALRCAPSCAPRCATAWRAYGRLVQEVGGPSSCASSSLDAFFSSRLMATAGDKLWI